MQIFGVVNVSPDSLADFTIGTTPEEAAEVARRHIEDGADFIDIGGQASHGDATLVSPDQEWTILEAPLRAVVDLGVDVSVDTWQVETARRAFDAGAAVLNAADALQAPGMIELAAERECTVVLPFMLGPNPRHLKHVAGDPVGVMVDWFAEQLEKATKYGIRHRLLLDPGTGFAPAHWDWSERREYQKAIYTNLNRLRVFDLPLYVPVPWKQTSDRLELLDLVLAHDPEYARAHIPAQVIERHRQVLGRPR
ncbi:MAG: dihydropteroate synthase [Actinobacteria bacterium]|nr:dihydropteroate synthase [Actinomycetota bacterium]